MAIPSGAVRPEEAPAPNAEGTFEHVGRTAEAYGQTALQMGREGLQQGQRMLRDNPAAGVLIAFGVGFGLGLILKR